MSAPYFVHGVELVGVDETVCDACGDRKPIGRSVGGLAICARCAGAAAVLADEYAQEVEAARQRRESRDRPALDRAKAKCDAQESVIGDRQRGKNGGKVRKNNAARGTSSPRSAADRRRYLADPDKKIAQVKARQALMRRAQP